MKRDYSDVYNRLITINRKLESLIKVVDGLTEAPEEESKDEVPMIEKYLEVLNPHEKDSLEIKVYGGETVGDLLRMSRISWGYTKDFMLYHGNDLLDPDILLKDVDSPIEMRPIRKW